MSIDRGPEILTGRRILVVEDDYFIASEIAAELGALGAVIVGPAGSLNTAMALLANPQTHIEAGALDINLQGQLVYPLADVLIQRSIPFILCTGYGERAIPDPYCRVPRCCKPFDIHALTAALARASGA